MCVDRDDSAGSHARQVGESAPGPSGRIDVSVGAYNHIGDSPFIQPVQQRALFIDDGSRRGLVFRSGNREPFNGRPVRLGRGLSGREQYPSLGQRVVE